MFFQRTHQSIASLEIQLGDWLNYYRRNIRKREIVLAATSQWLSFKLFQHWSVQPIQSIQLAPQDALELALADVPIRATRTALKVVNASEVMFYLEMNVCHGKTVDANTAGNITRHVKRLDKN